MITSLQDTVTSYDGHRIPGFGFSTIKLPVAMAFESVKFSIYAGYRNIAIACGTSNEAPALAGVREAIQEYGIQPEELTIAFCFPSDHSPGDNPDKNNRQENKVDGGKDLLLPWECQKVYLQVPGNLDNAVCIGERPVVFVAEDSLLSRFHAGTVFSDTIISISRKYRKSPEQICIRWLLQNNIIPYVCSTCHAMILEYSQVFDFMLSREEMDLLGNDSSFR